MKVNLYNQQAKKLKSTVELIPEIFELKPNKALLAQYVRIYLANKRQGTAKTKTRAEVSGGGKKPWRQKGTGRARHGSIRSPLWVGGGVTFGPQPRDWHLRLPKKMRRRALRAALSEKARKGRILVLNRLALDGIGTKKMQEIISVLSPDSRERLLLVLPEVQKEIILSARNIPRLETVLARNLNTYDILRAGRLILLKDSLKAIEETFGE